MLDFKLQDDKCIECGLCAKVCPVSIIELKPKAAIKEGKEKNCLKCQHCLAVCPTAAISIFGKNPVQSVLVNDEHPSGVAMANHIKTRRSIRKYKQENVDEKIINELMKTASHAPTGHNSNSVLFSVIDNMEDMHIFRSKVYDAIKKAKEEGRLPEKHKLLASFQKVWENHGVDIIFRNAPHFIVTSAPNRTSSPVADSTITLTYFEFAANAHGIGTLWNGMVTWAMEEVDTDLKTLIGIPEDHKIGYSMIFGKPEFKYTRGIQSEGLYVNKISLK